MSAATAQERADRQAFCDSLEGVEGVETIDASDLAEDARQKGGFAMSRSKDGKIHVSGFDRADTWAMSPTEAREAARAFENMADQIAPVPVSRKDRKRKPDLALVPPPPPAGPVKQSYAVTLVDPRADGQNIMLGISSGDQSVDILMDEVRAEQIAQRLLEYARHVGAAKLPDAKNPPATPR